MMDKDRGNQSHPLDHLGDIVHLQDIYHNDQVECYGQNIRHGDHQVCKNIDSVDHENKIVQCHSDKSDDIEIRLELIDHHHLKERMRMRMI
jgi:hypothetical protein